MTATPLARGGIGKSIVIGDDAIEVVAEVECCSEVDGVEGSQDRWVETSGIFENCRGDLDEGDGVEQPSGADDSIGGHSTNSPEQLGTGQVARHRVSIGLGEPGVQGSRFRFSDDELRQRGRVEVVRRCQ